MRNRKPLSEGLLKKKHGRPIGISPTAARNREGRVHNKRNDDHGGEDEDNDDGDENDEKPPASVRS